MRILKICALALALVLALAWPAAAKEKLKIGAVFSATGPASFLGEPEKNTLELIEDMINEQGGVLGQEIEFIIYDDETDVNKCVLAADKLIKKDRVLAVIGPSVSGNTLAIMNKFPAAKIPLISCAASEKIVKPVNPWVFKTPQSDRHAVSKILEHAGAAGYKDIAIITVSNGYGQSGRDVLKELIPEHGMTLVADEVYGPKDTDMTAQLTKIKAQNPGAIVCWGTNPGPAVICRNRVQLGIAAPLYQSHGVASRKFIELAGEAAEGVMLPAGHISVADRLPDGHPQKQVLTTYVTAYEKRFGTKPSAFGGYAWDAAHLIFEAIAMGASAEPQSIRDNMEKIQGFVGASGVFNFSPEDHNGLTKDAFLMLEIVNGDWNIIE